MTDGNRAIECKWQQSSGSVDEKFPYVYLNAVEAMPKEHVIILVDGGGAKPNAVAWLKRAAESGLYKIDHGKRIQVMGLADFTAWANRYLCQEAYAPLLPGDADRPLRSRDRSGDL